MTATRTAIIAALLFLLAPLARAGTADPGSDAFWYGTAADGAPTVRLYYFYSPTCPHCQAAKPLPRRSRGPEALARDRALRGEGQPGQRAVLFRDREVAGRRGAVGARLRVLSAVTIGYDSAATTGAELERALDACHAERVGAPGRRERDGPAGAAGTAAAAAGLAEAANPAPRSPPARRLGERAGVLAAGCSRWCSPAWTRSIPARSSCCCSC